ncbi:ATP-dependent DNA helicase RecQ [Arthrobacter sp. Sa2CUA1]|uniref:ATP-dependent DNA helicase RecQ n=2 Tax=Arthrobacter TaxID=1663 RepID=A0ABR8UQG9_9MICC|nr:MULTISPECIES: ATP-dependent DNA helicase RecQ [Arthrobacter]MBD7994779.1 ATP-dependent DNA helicase RecQ [Arthrobacter gallicola]MBD8042494.1 ATP-dependent DNA helicase RecQ [Arthrobacter pullicola]
MSPSRADLQRTAARVFGWEDFRPGQLEAMEAASTGRDVLCIMPTGAGKSAVYQVPAMAMPGTAVVISPLIALQQDQADAINEAVGRTAAYVLNSAQSQAYWDEAWAAAEGDGAGQAKFLFLGPEQVARAEVAERLRALDVSLVVIDEAHCVSAWGHDFRPDYLQLDLLVKALERPVVALTATASPPVRAEIVEQLGMRNELQVSLGFDRPNLRLSAARHENPEDKRRAILAQTAQLPGPGLLYVATRRETEEYAQALQEKGLRADAYHSGRRHEDRQQIHEQFLNDALDVVVATTAFGMGIDKPNVRFVVHADVPDSVDSYYQEIGRGGRDGEPCGIFLHYRPEDLGLRRFFAAKSPNEEALSQVFKVVKRHDAPVSADTLRQDLDISARRLSGQLSLLEQSGSVQASGAGYTALPVTAAKAVQAAVEFAEKRENIDSSRLEMMRQYAETGDCRRRFLLNYFGEDAPDMCGNCDNCERAEERGEELGPQEPAGEQPFPLQSEVTHAEWGRGMVMSYDDGTVTVLFDSEGYKTLSVDVVLEKELLRAQ